MSSKQVYLSVGKKKESPHKYSYNQVIHTHTLAVSDIRRSAGETETVFTVTWIRLQAFRVRRRRSDSAGPKKKIKKIIQTAGMKNVELSEAPQVSITEKTTRKPKPGISESVSQDQLHSVSPTSPSPDVEITNTQTTHGDSLIQGFTLKSTSTNEQNNNREGRGGRRRVCGDDRRDGVWGERMRG